MRGGTLPAIQGRRDSPPVPGRRGAAPISENWRGTRAVREAMGGRRLGKRHVKSACQPSSCSRPTHALGAPGQSRVRGAGVVAGVLRSPRTVSRADGQRWCGPERAAGSARDDIRSRRPGGTEADAEAQADIGTGPSPAAVPRLPRRRSSPRTRATAGPHPPRHHRLPGRTSSPAAGRARHRAGLQGRSSPQSTGTCATPGRTGPITGGDPPFSARIAAPISPALPLFPFSRSPSSASPLPRFPAARLPAFRRAGAGPDRYVRFPARAAARPRSVSWQCGRRNSAPQDPSTPARGRTPPHWAAHGPVRTEPPCPGPEFGRPAEMIGRWYNRKPIRGKSGIPRGRPKNLFPPPHPRPARGGK